MDRDRKNVAFISYEKSVLKFLRFRYYHTSHSYTWITDPFNYLT
jgi:hypothetical protein